MKRIQRVLAGVELTADESGIVPAGGAGPTPGSLQAVR
jgi:hypothetical protein